MKGCVGGEEKGGRAKTKIKQNSFCDYALLAGARVLTLHSHEWVRKPMAL